MRFALLSCVSVPGRFLIAGLMLVAAGVLAAPPAATPVFITEARLAAIEERIEALGTLRANETVDLTASVTETVTAINFDDGDRVEAGHVLAEMTSDEEHAQLEEARVTVDEAQRQYQRIKSLRAQQSASEQETCCRADDEGEDCQPYENNYELFHRIISSVPAVR